MISASSSVLLLLWYVDFCILAYSIGLGLESWHEVNSVVVNKEKWKAVSLLVRSVL